MAAIGKAELRQYQEELAGALRNLSARMEGACRSFNRNRLVSSGASQGGGDADVVGKAGTIFERISAGLHNGLSEQELTELLRIRSVLAFVNGVQQPIEKLAECVRMKVEESVLYGDSALRGMNDLFAKGQFVMDSCADAVQTGNPILKAHVICGAEFVLALIAQCAALPPERVAGGSRASRAVALYSAMLDEFRSVMSFLKEIASHIPGEVELETWACPSGRPRPEEKRA